MSRKKKCKKLKDQKKSTFFDGKNGKTKFKTKNSITENSK